MVGVVKKENAINASVKPASKAFNFFWIIFAGIWQALIAVIEGAALCLTIVGIPSAIVIFKSIPLLFHPFGREVIIDYGKHKFWNTYYLIFGGSLMVISQLALAIILCITIVGIPLAKQVYKSIIYHMAPYGSEVVNTGNFTSSRTSKHDFGLLLFNILHEDKIVKMEDGSEMKATKAMYSSISDEERQKLRLLFDEKKFESESPDNSKLETYSATIDSSIIVTQIYSLFAIMALYEIVVLILGLGFDFFGIEFLKAGNWLYWLFPLCVAVVLIGESSTFIHYFTNRKIYNFAYELYKKYWVNITTYYPGDKQLKTFIYTKKKVAELSNSELNHVSSEYEILKAIIFRDKYLSD